ncbi:hypothetical protein MA16_Dca007484 [Dendrobium catenatum]|uniref:Uncharacterized protein n=1 Tax=Dendrobium catenatum TaxID=906689 RepID=A0A2I0WB85_9ASPA|nr:hypothetical protein MA16_Dca007484 [Dendrobium catenatum]
MTRRTKLDRCRSSHLEPRETLRPSPLSVVSPYLSSRLLHSNYFGPFTFCNLNNVNMHAPSNSVVFPFNSSFSFYFFASREEFGSHGVSSYIGASREEFGSHGVSLYIGGSEATDGSNKTEQRKIEEEKPLQILFLDFHGHGPSWGQKQNRESRDGLSQSIAVSNDVRFSDACGIVNDRIIYLKMINHLLLLVKPTQHQLWRCSQLGGEALTKSLPPSPHFHLPRCDGVAGTFDTKENFFFGELPSRQALNLTILRCEPTGATVWNPPPHSLESPLAGSSPSQTSPVPHSLSSSLFNFPPKE